PGQDGVADELLGRAAEALDLAGDELEQVALEVAYVFGVGLLAERRRSREIRKQDRHDPPFLAVVDAGSAGVVAERVAAARAEAGGGRLLGAAVRTCDVERGAAGAAKPRPGRLLGTAGCAADTHARVLTRASAATD